MKVKRYESEKIWKWKEKKVNNVFLGQPHAISWRDSTPL